MRQRRGVGHVGVEVASRAAGACDLGVDVDAVASGRPPVEDVALEIADQEL